MKQFSYLKKKKDSTPAICFSTFLSQVQFPGTFVVVEMPQSQATYQITKANGKAE